MNHRSLSTRARILIALGGLAVALATAGSIFLAVRPSYDDHVNACIEALEERPDGDTAKPGPCEPLARDDYAAVLVSRVIDEQGWTDDTGRFDKNEMLEDVR